eukprot:CAMPEP_0170161544 /NCGR_PEP_ID=MMETSP0033_2-20121228/76314_1 /TAXON_ID=195969 /ORGANISM="Dolichomastix tenuilepis, Strain CCMP3274" /LENGTH=322 /DNA_ID=CAMNT_0010399153 /DNA_START=1 /DNA_END=966 /DNA_ORIENTATION=+
MAPEEALADAVEQFELQGVDLSNIRKTLPEEGGRAELKIVGAVKALEAAVAGGDGDVGACLEAVTEELVGDAAEVGAGLAAGRNGGVEAVLSAVSSAATEGTLLQALAALKAVLQEVECKDFFLARGGVKTLVEGVMEAERGASVAVAEASALAVCAAATKAEDNKLELMKAGVGPLLIKTLPVATKAACSALKALVSADDPRKPAPAAFAHARWLAKDGAPLGLLTALDTARDNGDGPLLALVCATLKCVAVNDEICKEVEEAGGLARVISAARAGVMHTGSGKHALALLRQLAGRDQNKSAILDAGGVDAALSLVQAHAA